MTRRDAFDCDDLQEFTEFHRVESRATHAFNVPQPGGLAIDRDRLQALEKREGKLRNLCSDLQTALKEGELDGIDAEFYAERASKLNLEFASAEISGPGGPSKRSLESTFKRRKHGIEDRDPNDAPPLAA